MHAICCILGFIQIVFANKIVLIACNLATSGTNLIMFAFDSVPRVHFQHAICTHGISIAIMFAFALILGCISTSFAILGVFLENADQLGRCAW